MTIQNWHRQSQRNLLERRIREEERDREQSAAGAPLIRERELTPEASEAIAYAKAYEGDRPFMLKMKAKAQNPFGWTPSAKQAATILHCKQERTAAW